MNELDRIRRYKAIFEARTVQGKKLREVAEELTLWPNQVTRGNKRYRLIAEIYGFELPPRRKLVKEWKKNAPR